MLPFLSALAAIWLTGMVPLAAFDASSDRVRRVGLSDRLIVYSTWPVAFSIMWRVDRDLFWHMVADLSGWRAAA